jgi:hypothetical protein
LIENPTTPAQDAGKSTVHVDDDASQRERVSGWILPTTGWAIVFAIIPFILVILGIETALHFGGPPIDGPFQVYNALRRITAGQRPGVDFQFFHGLGIPYLMYLPFRLFGGTFAASEITRQVIATVSAPVAVLVFLRCFTGDWRRAFALSTLVLAVSIALGQWPMLLAVNSLLVVRAALPTIAPVIWVLRLRRRTRAMSMGVAIGASVLLGTEQGLAVLLAFLVVGSIVAWRSSERRLVFADVGLTVGASAATVALFLLLLGGLAGMKGALRYNLKLVPMDQYWYFGVPPNLFVTGWKALPRLLMHEPLIPTAIIVGVIAAAAYLHDTWHEIDDAVRRRHAALAMLAIYGLIACVSLLGIFLVSYVEPLVRALLIIGALELDRRMSKTKLRGATAYVVSRGVLVMAALLLMVIRAPTMIQSFASRLPEVLRVHGRGNGMQFESLWPATISSGQRIVDAHRTAGGRPPTLWSTYAGLLEARNGIFQPTTDYIIHVLGPENRAAYVNAFRAARPTLVQTVRPTYSEYEPWIEQTSWDFYRELLRNYRALDATPWSIFWERLPTPAAEPSVFWSATLSGGADAVEIPMPPSPTGNADAMLVQIELQYRIRNPLGKLPIVGGVPRYLVVPSGAVTNAPVTIDPYTTTTWFPLIAVEGRRVRLRFATYSLLPGARIEVERVRAAAIPITRANYPWLNDLAKATSLRSAAAR